MNKDHKINIALQIDSRYEKEIDSTTLTKLIRATLESESILQAELSLVITDDTTIQDLNRTYRHVDAPTDVLAFSANEQETDANFITATEAELEILQYLGDIIVSYPTATRQAARLGHSVMAELSLLTVHGVLHLLRYDHTNPEDKKVMWQKQQKLLKDFG